MLFKGTPKLKRADPQEFDGLGAEINAATSKEATVLHAHFLDEHLERAFEVMGDMLLRTTYADIDSEREVVLEEIAMYEDEPQDKVHDVLSEGIFGDHPLGRPVLGRGEVVGGLTVDKVSAYHDARYVPVSIVVAAAGNLEHAEIERLAGMWLRDGARNGGAGRSKAPAAARRGQRVAFHSKETEQYHICLGGEGIARNDERRFALSILDAILGGSTPSRLFQEVREKRGLAYAVYSWASQYQDTGQVGIYVGTREDNVVQALDVIGTELERVRQEPVGDEELRLAGDERRGVRVDLGLARDELRGAVVELRLPVDECRLRVRDLLPAVDDLGRLVIALRLGRERIDDLGHAIDLRRLRDEAGDGRLLGDRERRPVGRVEHDGATPARHVGERGSQVVGHLGGLRAGNRDLPGRRAAAGEECPHADREDGQPGPHHDEASSCGEPADPVEQLCHVELRECGAA